VREVLLVDAVRTPIGRHGGALARVRPDDLAATAIAGLVRRTGVDPSSVDDVILGCANQAGEDTRNVARMALLLAGLPVEVPGQTVNRLCGSGLQALASAAQAIRAGEGDVFIAGGVESMSRAPWVILKPEDGFPRTVPAMADTTIGWRFVNPRMRDQYGVDSMGETAENVAECFTITRKDQDIFACNSQMKAAAARDKGRFEREITPVTIPAEKKGKEPKVFAQDEFIRADTTLEILGKLKAAFRANGSVTAGNSSGINDGAAALLIASESAVERYSLEPMARIVSSAAAGVEPRIMGMGPVPSSRKALERAGLTLDQMDVIELNEAFAAQSLACLRELGIADDDPRVNPNGGAIALGHPLGMSGARLLLTAAHELKETGGRYSLCTMCVGVGQGMATIIERV